MKFLKSHTETCISLLKVDNSPNFKKSGTGEMTTKKDRKKALGGSERADKTVSTSFHSPSTHAALTPSHHAIRDLHSVHEQNMHNRDPIHAPGTVELHCRESIRGERI